MKFSFIIPVYRSERFLPRCLESLVAQTFSDFECIIVDDGSPRPPEGESCAEIVARYDDRFRCIRHDRNRSAFQARMTAIRAAHGEYLVPVDPDDYVLPELLARGEEALRRENADVASYWIDYDDRGRIYPHHLRHPAGTLSGIEAISEVATNRMFPGVASKFLRRATVTEAIAKLDVPENLYVNTADDFLLLLSTLLASQKVLFMEYAGYRYFVNLESTSFSWQDCDGYGRACQQVAISCRLLDGLSPVFAPATENVQRYFISEALKADPCRIRQCLEEAKRNFPERLFADVLSEKYVEVVSSRAFRMAASIWRMFDLFRSKTV